MKRDKKNSHLTKIKNYFLSISVLLLSQSFLALKAKAEEAEVISESLWDKINNQVFAFRSQAGFEYTSPTLVVANILIVIFTLLGVIFLALIIYGGFLWMTARGNEEQIKKAGSVLTNAVIGLIIIIASYAITYWVTYWLAQATEGGNGGPVI